MRILIAVVMGLAILSCSSPMEPEPEVGLFMYGTVTSERNEREYEWGRIWIDARCEDCEDAIFNIRIRENGSYGVKIPNPNRHFGHEVKADLYCPVERGAIKLQMRWDEFPKTPVGWNPVLP